MIRIAWRVVVLLGTSWVLVATSRPRDCSQAVESVAFRVEGTCGPTGVVVISTDGRCGLTVDGGPEVLLPSTGNKLDDGPLASARLSLGGPVQDLDGGPVPLTDGGLRFSPDGCDGGCPFTQNYRSCTGSPVDGGVFELSCLTDDTDPCEVRLVP